MVILTMEHKQSYHSNKVEAITATVQHHVTMLAHTIGERNVYKPDALQAAANYITQQWENQGFQVTPQTYLTHNLPCANLEITIIGDTNPEEIILVGAHYDSVIGSPGADDNASAVAALLEIASCLKKAQIARTIRLVAFVNEEPPFFYWSRDMGSLVYAKTACQNKDNIRFMIALEMLGYYRDAPNSQAYPPLLRHFYPHRGNFIAFVSRLRDGYLVKHAFNTFRAHCDFPAEWTSLPGWLPGIGWSDHSSFWRQGYPAIMVTDTAFFRNPFYHTAEDTPEKLDYQRLAQVTVGLTSMLIQLANDDT